MDGVLYVHLVRKKNQNGSVYGHYFNASHCEGSFSLQSTWMRTEASQMIEHKAFVVKVNVTENRQSGATASSTVQYSQRHSLSTRKPIHQHCHPCRDVLQLKNTSGLDLVSHVNKRVHK